VNLSSVPPGTWRGPVGWKPPPHSNRYTEDKAGSGPPVAHGLEWGTNKWKISREDLGYRQ
jgi:hypothetical protein